MLNENVNEQTIALAGLYQSCQVVSNIAWNGEYKEKDIIPLINCIMQIDSANTENIYIDVSKLHTGLIFFRKQIAGDIFSRSSETRRYIASLKQLADNLMSDENCINKIQMLLKELNLKSDTINIDDKVTELSSIYQKTLSNFEPRIVVNGENKYLTNNINASRIRTALFAGVRSIILWRQLGGSRLKLLLFKGKYSKQIDSYLDSIID
tara:strand:- start:1120 stop:1746 length:627 start_codon:yes stop_codon:yes gene_type:complete